MKEKVKIWSRRRLLGAFLAFLGLAAVATAQNGTVNANCGGQLIAITRTADQMNSSEGITFPLTFTGVEAGDEYYFVAAEGGSFSSIATGTGCGLTPNQLGANLNVVSPRPNGTSPAPSMAGSFTDITLPINVNVKPINTVSGGEVYYLGVFVKDLTTSCYSDVYWVRINVENNIYAYLNLTTTNDSNQYICNQGTTIDLGITLCSLPGNGELNYTVETFNMVNDVTIDGYNNGLRIASTGNNEGEVIMSAGTPQVAAIDVALDGATDYKSISIGTQTLHNPSPEKAGELEFRFTNMTYIYTDNAGDRVELPVKFITGNECDAAMGTGRTGIYDSIFNVHVAPNFSVQALAYATGDARTTATTSYSAGTITSNTTLSEPTFCQGTIAYLFGETSASEGKTTYAWANSTDPVAANNTTFTDAAIQNPNTAELTEFGNNAYTLLLTGTWNDLETGGHYGAGCQITDLMPINVTAAPILLLATDETVKGDDTWNSTNIITASEQCPGTPILISTDKEGTPVTDGTGRTDSINAGNFIKHNDNTISWYITTDADAAAYTAWRSGEITAVNETSALTIDANDTDDDTDLTHYFDNSNNANPAEVKNVTYTLYNANGCALVKSDGSSLTGGKVQIVFPVEPRPQFQLGAN